ncbi:MAG: COX15/CtaA family protein [Burkholderiales bacterium]
MKPGPVRVLVLAALLLVLVIITTSAYIRLSQAGFGCADWPACYDRNAASASAGHMLPVRPSLYWARALHRLAASSAGILLLLIVVLGWNAPRVRLAAMAAVALAGFLAWLGRFTPSDLPAVTVANLLGGMAMLALLSWLHRSGRGTNAGRTLRWLALAALALQIALGGMIGARHAVVSCVTLPGCTGGWWPDPVDWRLFNPFLAISAPDPGSAARVALVMAHRYGAMMVAALLCALGVNAIRRGARVAGCVLLCLLATQLALGAGMVLADFPLLLVLLHNLCAALLLGTTAGLYRHNSATREET